MNDRVAPKLSRAGKLLLLTAASMALAIPSAFAQQAATAPANTKPLTFDVVTIKPHDQSVRPNAWTLNPTPDGYTAANVSLLKLVSQAYGIFDPKLITGGPPWIDKDKFDLEAKFDPSEIPNAKDLTYRQRSDMLRAVLADRFHLKVHFETKDFPAYNLVTAKGGPKLTETKPEDIHTSLGGSSCIAGQLGGMAKGQGCTAAVLANQLRNPTGRTVIDKTGLTARYDFELHWSSDNTPADSPAAVYPTIFTAVQEQLGLKLEPSTAPLDILVIDSAEPPTPN
jgi:uncharacterized protein (TIGR03435 family)